MSLSLSFFKVFSIPVVVRRSSARRSKLLLQVPEDLMRVCWLYVPLASDV